MSKMQNSKFFIFIAMCFAISSQMTEKELGVDQCSHKHFLVVDKFFEDSIWSHYHNPTVNYRFVQCSRETPVGTYYRQYVFAIQVGEVTCNFAFKVQDVKVEKTLTDFSPLEVKDFESCKSALKNAGIISEVAAEDTENWNELKPLVHEIEEKLVNEDSENWDELKPLFDDIEDTLSNPETEKWDELKPLLHDIETKLVKEDSENWDELKPLFHDIEDKIAQHDNIKKARDINEEEVDFDVSSLFEGEEEFYNNHSKKAEEKAHNHHIGKSKNEEEIDMDISSLFEEENDNSANSDEKLHFLNAKNADEPKTRKNLGMVEEDLENETVPEDNTPVKKFIAGGFSKCNTHTLKQIPHLFITLANQNVLKSVVVYSENVTKCEVQVVAGLNYKLTITLNDESCNYIIYEDLSGNVSLTSDVADASPACKSYFTESFLQSHKELL